MTIHLVSITSRGASKSAAAQKLAAEYIERTSRYCQIEHSSFSDEASFFQWIDKSKGRTSAYSVLLDSRGRTLSSEEFAHTLSKLQDEGQQRVVLAIGPANGWSAEARQQAQMLFSLGRITLPHELAKIVLAEQIYRAFTILAGHPYHSGH